MSPFKSKAQVAFMHARKPEVAKRWRKKYGVPKNLPQNIDETVKRARMK